MVVKLGNHPQVKARRWYSLPIERAKTPPTLKNHAVIQATNMVHGVSGTATRCDNFSRRCCRSAKRT